MKQIITLIIISLFTTVELSFSQCDAMSNKSKGVEQLSSGFTFIKSYLLDGGKENSKGEIEYSFVFQGEKINIGTTSPLTLEMCGSGEARWPYWMWGLLRTILRGTEVHRIAYIAAIPMAFGKSGRIFQVFCER